MKNILVINGPNLDMLGVREPGVYGTGTLADLQQAVWEHCRSKGVSASFFQSNSEGELIDRIHAANGTVDGIVYNPGAHTHYSYALRDAVGGIDVPCVEVHISDVDSREAFRHVSVIAPACVAQVKGRGFAGYCDAVDILLGGARTRLGEGFEDRYPKGQVIIGAPEAGKGSAPAEEGEGDTEKEPSSPGVIGEPAGPSSPAGVAVARLARLREAIADEGADAFHMRDLSAIRWATAFDGVFDSEAAHALVVTPGRAVLQTDSRYSAACEKAAKGAPIEVDAERGAHAVRAAALLGFGDSGEKGAVADEAEEGAAFPAGSPSASGAGGRPFALGIEDDVSLSEFRALEKAFPGVDLRETHRLAQGLRAVKDADEIARLRAAQAITDAAFAHIIGFMRPGMTEREVQLELEDYMVRHGADGLAFSSIVATGANGASPHAIPGQTRLEPGQCVVLDFGARARGYCSDMTRTVFLGEPSPRMRSAYETIRRANEEVAAMLRPGVTGAEAHSLAERILEEGGFGGKMGHGLGHGVGIDVHETPSLSPRNDDPLVVGNVVTVEPGIYLAGEFGMRLEDFGVVTADGFEVFTTSPHDMVIL